MSFCLWAHLYISFPSKEIKENLIFPYVFFWRPWHQPIKTIYVSSPSSRSVSRYDVLHADKYIIFVSHLFFRQKCATCSGNERSHRTSYCCFWFHHIDSFLSNGRRDLTVIPRVLHTLHHTTKKTIKVSKNPIKMHYLLRIYSWFHHAPQNQNFFCLCSL